MQEDTLSLIFKSKIFTIPSRFRSLNDVKSDIYESLLANQKYEVKSNVSEEVFKSFINHWVNRETPDINQNNLFEYELLSEEFDRMRGIIDIFKKQQQNQNNNFSHDEEKQAQENIIQNLKSIIAKKDENMKHIAKKFLINDSMPTEINNNENRYDLYLAIIEENVKKIDLLINHKFVTYKNVLYIINEKEKTAGVYNFDCSIKSLIIPIYIEYNQQKYRVTTILENSIKNNGNTSLVSCKHIEKIEKGAFIDSPTKIILSSKVELEDGWQKIGFDFEDILIDPNEIQRITLYDNKFVIGKSDPKIDKYDVIHFVKNGFEKVTIPSFIKQIFPFAFFGCSTIHYVVIQPNLDPILIRKNAFSHSKIKYLSLPSNCELEDGWQKRVFASTTIEIVSNGEQRITWYDDKLIIGKSDPKSDRYDVIHFAKKDIEKITIPSFIKRIASFAFSNCKNLQVVEFEDNSELEVIGKYAFEYCLFEKISIPRNVTYIMKQAFNTNKLKKIEFSKESKLKVIGEYAFNDTLIENITIPSTIIEFGDGFLPKTSNFVSLNIMPNNKILTKYGQFYILEKSSIEKDQYDVLFYARKNIEVAIIPSFIKRIAKSAFEYCSKLKKIEFEKNSQLKVIDKFAFSSLSLNGDIIIPPSVTHIKQFAFSDCKNIRSLEFQENSELLLLDEAFIYSKMNCISFKSKFLKIKADTFAADKIQIIELNENIESFCIHPNAFIDSKIKKLMIPSQLKNLHPNIKLRVSYLNYVNL